MKTSPSKSGSITSILISSEVARMVRQHARSNLAAEVCGVLIGVKREGALRVEACIEGKNATQAGTHVTFTQDTWEHIYKIKDVDYPESRIVGWYHSHPGFGVFLSDHDTFIQRNFFSAAEQIAWVYDPHSDEEGFFGWTGDRITRVGEVTFTDSRGGEDSSEGRGPEPAIAVSDEPAMDFEPAERVRLGNEFPPALRWTVSIVSYLAAVCVGLLIAWYIFPRILAVPVPVDPQTGRPLVPMPEGVVLEKSQPQAQPQAAPNDRNTAPDGAKTAPGASEDKSAQRQ